MFPNHRFSFALVFLACLLGAFALFGCAAPGTVAPPSPAQVAAQVCPPLQVALTNLQAIEGLTPAEQTNLAKTVPVVGAVCNAGAAVSVTSLQSLSSTALPALIGVIKDSSLSADNKNQAVVGITAAQIVLAAVLAAQSVPVAPVPAAPPVSAATVPATK